MFLMERSLGEVLVVFLSSTTTLSRLRRSTASFFLRECLNGVAVLSSRLMEREERKRKEEGRNCGDLC